MRSFFDVNFINYDRVYKQIITILVYVDFLNNFEELFTYIKFNATKIIYKTEFLSHTNLITVKQYLKYKKSIKSSYK